MKTTEDVGELAKAILPYENEPGSLRNFSDKQKILEEVADTILGTLSMANNFNFTHEKIESILCQKSKYCALLHAKGN